MQLIEKATNDAITVIQQLQDTETKFFIEESAKRLADLYSKGNKVIIAGNGGSLCDAMHFAEELTGQFRKKRRALPAIALACPGHITCAANDFGFDEVFARGVEAYGQKGDLFVGLTTSGNSPNIMKAFQKAKEMQLQSIAFLGKGGGRLKGFADLELIVKDMETSDRIQELHMCVIHILIEVLEHKLFYSDKQVEAVFCT